MRPVPAGVLPEKLLKGDAVQRLFDLFTHPAPDHPGDAVVGLVAATGYAGFEAVGKRDGPSSARTTSPIVRSAGFLASP